MPRFRSMQSLQKFAAVQASVRNHFNLERHLYSRPDFENTRATALDDKRQIAARTRFCTHKLDSQISRVVIQAP